MERDRSARIIAIVALILAVSGLTVGFSLYSQTLTINDMKAEVKGDPDRFKVQFSSNADSQQTGSVSGTVEYTGDGISDSTVAEGKKITADAATLNETTISNIKATFGSAGKVTYTFYIRNNGDLKAWLKSVTHASLQPTCKAKTDTTDSYVQDACKKDITMDFRIGDTPYNENTPDISGVPLAIGEKVQASITINYTGQTAVDGDFDVTFGDITVIYSSQD